MFPVGGLRASDVQRDREAVFLHAYPVKRRNRCELINVFETAVSLKDLRSVYTSSNVRLSLELAWDEKALGSV